MQMFREERLVRMWSCLVAVVLIGGLTACGRGQSGANDTADGVSSVTSGTTIVRIDARGGSIGAPLAGVGRFDVDGVDITVPASLVVSEANLFFPNADIVWRADPLGDRYAQVKSVLEEGFAAGVAAMDSGPKAVVAIRLERFHALTEKARFSVGGVHDIVVVMMVKDASTGEVLEGPRRVEVAIRASGGDKAIAEDAAGNTQRVVIVAGLAEAIRRHLALVPVGIETKRKGLFRGLSLKRGTQ